MTARPTATQFPWHGFMDGFTTERTVPTFNFYTKCLAQRGHNTRPHAQLQKSFVSMDIWITSKLNVVLTRKLRGSLVC